jgi:hypothetical protein
MLPRLEKFPTLEQRSERSGMLDGMVCALIGELTEECTRAEPKP